MVVTMIFKSGKPRWRFVTNTCGAYVGKKMNALLFELLSLNCRSHLPYTLLIIFVKAKW